MKWILYLLLPFFTFSQTEKQEVKKINIDSLLQTDEYQGIEIEKYTVKKGERLRNIYLKYKITPGEIYRLNPEAKDSLKVGSVLLIPLQKKVVYREWLNPKWVKQNEVKLKYRKKKENIKKDTINIAENKTNDKKIINKKNNKSGNNKIELLNNKIEPKITNVKPKDTIIQNTNKTISEEIKKQDIETIVKDTIYKEEIVEEVSNKKKKNKKKSKKEEKYGSPEDHNVFLDPKNKAHYVLHEIEDGETLISIAKDYKVPVYALLEFNKKVDFNKVMAGNLMKVPNIEKEIVQKFIIDLITVYKSKNIKYDKDVTKKEFTYNDEDE
jgi:LysM repeat protein